MSSTGTLFTVGHSNRTLDELIALVKSARLDVIADVRRFPRSRRHPWFDGRTLGPALVEAGVEYHHLEGLGGHRGTPPDEAQALVGALDEPWSGYAWHARTAPEFASDLGRLEVLAQTQRTAVLCAEKSPAHCHRSVIADLLVLQGWKVVHVTEDGETAHEKRDEAELEDGLLTYRPLQGRLF
ncbi:MAG: DUF488 domain-containing protein [Acidobacteriota bacterium]